MTSTLPSLHQNFVDRLIVAVRDQPSILAVLAGGSLIHGGMDQWSDLDFVIVVDDADYHRFMSSRLSFAAGLGSLLSAFGGEHVGEPRLLICLYGPKLLHVDLKCVTADDLDRRIERPYLLYARDHCAIEARLDKAVIRWPDQDAQWFEDRVWIWLHYAVTKWGRGELFEAIGMIGFIRDQVLGPMLHRRAGQPQRGVRRIESPAIVDGASLKATVASHDRDSVADAIRAASALYLDLRTDCPPPKEIALMPQALFQLMTE